MIKIEDVNVFVTGTQPNANADNSSGPATADGFEFIAEFIDNSIIGPQQALMDYADLTPNGVTEAAGASQMIEAMQLGFGVIPGRVFRRDTFDDPSVFGDRSLLLTEQGILFAAFPELDAAVYVGDANSVAVAAAGGYYYHSLNADGTTPNTAGPYLQLPPNPSPVGLRQYSEALTAGLTVTGANWTTSSAVFLPYKALSGDWRVVFNIQGDISPATTSIIITVSGVTFKNIGVDNGQAVSVNVSTAGFGAHEDGSARTASNTDTIRGITTLSSATKYFFSGDVELDAIPTWVQVFDIKHAITY